MSTNEVVSNNIKIALIEKQMTSKCLANMIGISYASIYVKFSRKQKTEFTLKEIDTIANALGISVVDLVTPREAKK